MEHEFAWKCLQAVPDETIVSEVEVEVEVVAAEAAVVLSVDVIVIGTLNFPSVESITSRVFLNGLCLYDDSSSLS